MKPHLGHVSALRDSARGAHLGICRPRRLDVRTNPGREWAGGRIRDPEVSRMSPLRRGDQVPHAVNESTKGPNYNLS